MPCASSQSVPDLLKSSFCKTLNRANRSFERFALFVFYLLDFCIIQPLQLSPFPVHCCELRCRIQQLLPDPFSDRYSDSWQSPDL